MPHYRPPARPVPAWQGAIFAVPFTGGLSACAGLASAGALVALAGARHGPPGRMALAICPVLAREVDVLHSCGMTNIPLGHGCA